eukprot:14555757-Alexandrium_andersonii.AAC.1
MVLPQALQQWYKDWMAEASSLQAEENPRRYLTQEEITVWHSLIEGIPWHICGSWSPWDPSTHPLPYGDN